MKAEFIYLFHQYIYDQVTNGARVISHTRYPDGLAKTKIELDKIDIGCWNEFAYNNKIKQVTFWK